MVNKLGNKRQQHWGVEPHQLQGWSQPEVAVIYTTSFLLGPREQAVAVLLLAEVTDTFTTRSCSYLKASVLVSPSLRLVHDV